MDKLPIQRYSDMSSLWSPMNLSPFWWNDDSMFSVAQRNFSRMMDDMLDNMRMGMPMASQRGIPGADVSEDRKSFRVKLPVPGLEADDIDISTADGMLTISAERQQKKGGVESSYSFSQSMTLPEGVDINKADVTLSNHMLSIEIPKVNGQEQKIAIRNGGEKQQQQKQQKH